MSDDLKNNVIGYVQFDNEIAKYKEDIASLKERMNEIVEKRNNFESNLIRIIETNKLEKKDIIISDGKIKYNQTKTTASITKKYLETCFMKYFKNNKDAVATLLKFIYSERDVSVKTSIKRYNK